MAEAYAKVGNAMEAQRNALLGLEVEHVSVGVDSPLYQESVLRMRAIIGC